MSGLGDYPAAAVLRAEDLGRAKAFYTDVLGLNEMQPARPAGGVAMLIAGQGSMVMIYERPGMPAPESTALGFGIPPENFDAVISDLRAKGVVFEEYDMPEMDIKTVNGVAEVMGAKVAWLKDPEGNIINLAAM
jgi:catechol-2,3-dioxygenase